MERRIRIDSALVVRKLCSSRTEAQELIGQGAVFIDGVVCNKPARLVGEEVSITLTAKRPFVSRGGEKLKGCLLDVHQAKENVEKAVQGAVVLDVGSSTGGFTDCLLQFGAHEVDCVDVGTNQLHESLRNDKRIHVFENQDIRTFKTDKEYDSIVVDTSFISLKDIIPTLIALGTPGKTSYYILIKPQFEVGRGNTKKGIVKNEKLILESIEKVKDTCVSQEMKNIVLFPSHIPGGDGNQEYFLYGTL